MSGNGNALWPAPARAVVRIPTTAGPARSARSAKSGNTCVGPEPTFGCASTADENWGTDVMANAPNAKAKTAIANLRIMLNSPKEKDPARDYRAPRNSTDPATERTVDGGTSPTTVTSESPTRRENAEVGP